MSTEPTLEHLSTLSDDDLAAIDAWWRANNYLTVGQIYLQANPLLREPLSADDIKPRLLGHGGTSPGLAFIYAHASRLIRLTGQQMIYIAGPGHGGPSLTGASYLEGSYTPNFPHVTQDEPGLVRFCRQFSAPGGIPSHASVTTPGSIHEGGELGYALIHGVGAIFDNPDLIALTVVGDGEAETGPLEGSWKGISFVNPARDGAVLPVLHLNGAKIAGPTVLGRKSPEEVRSLLEGHGYEVVEVTGDDLPGMHHRITEALAHCYDRIKAIQAEARADAGRVASASERVETTSDHTNHAPQPSSRPRWPMIVLRTPKGWTGPEIVDGEVVEGTWRSHQVPLSGVKQDDAHRRLLEDWMRSYKPEELFDDNGHPSAVVLANNPEGDLRMSASPHANGGLLARDLDLPDIADYEVEVTSPGGSRHESTRVLGKLMRDIYRRNPDNFRLFCPDETNSNRLGAVFEASDRTWMESLTDIDVKLSPSGRVMEVLSEHNCHGWLEGYNLTGRHGLFATYEAFAMVSASQTIQHAKWLEEASHLEWRAKVPSLNILLSSTAWRNDHNGFSHQGPGLINNVIQHRGEVARVYLPPDANCLLSVSRHAFQSRSRVNLIVIDKQPQLQYLTLDEANAHCKRGASVWEWAGNEDPSSGDQPDIVLACAGDIVTMETIAAAQILREKLPELKVRVVNVVNLMTLSRPKDHPNGMSAELFSDLFTDTQHVIFSFHGYPGTIHQLVHGRPDADRFHCRGFIERGTTTTPFDMVVRNRASRYDLVIDAIHNTTRRPRGAGEVKAWCEEQLRRHETYIVEHLEDMPEVRDWMVQEATDTPEAH
ncbi:phosphoketolase family protein [Aestuariimicrobium ganziense]|uniref:phosphoketolase family protein n=1 Tax=Aestuariimicrobium ganziense TaxID=2773677 RepID=UPI001940CBF3|nr:phosphoketolase family protein [Aestuariimicrobium ganziense]